MEAETLDPAAMADLAIVSSLCIDSRLMRRLETAGIALVGNKTERELALELRP
jgi:hypothetical protein